MAAATVEAHRTALTVPPPSGRKLVVAPHLDYPQCSIQRRLKKVEVLSEMINVFCSMMVHHKVVAIFPLA